MQKRKTMNTILQSTLYYLILNLQLVNSLWWTTMEVELPWLFSLTSNSFWNCQSCSKGQGLGINHDFKRGFSSLGNSFSQSGGTVEVEVVQVWWGRNHQLNPTKTEWLWKFEPPRFGGSLSLTLDCRTNPHSKLMHTLGAFPHSQLQLNQQVAAMPRKAFAQLHLVHLCCPFLNQEAFQSLMPSSHSFITAMHSAAGCASRSPGSFN